MFVFSGGFGVVGVVVDDSVVVSVVVLVVTVVVLGIIVCVLIFLVQLSKSTKHLFLKHSWSGLAAKKFLHF